MAKAFGFSEKQAYDMGTTLTGLAGDVASFYNLSQDEAYTKLKSVFTGETESLKDLGVVMTQTALDSYAMANGFGKTTSAMTEAEKVALRYQFVQDQLSAAQGDFAVRLIVGQPVQDSEPADAITHGYDWTGIDQSVHSGNQGDQHCNRKACYAGECI